MDNKKVFSMSVAKIYPLLVAKAERKGRIKEEVDEVCSWLTGYTSEQIAQQIDKDVSYETFFNEAPQMNANCHLIKVRKLLLQYCICRRMEVTRLKRYRLSIQARKRIKGNQEEWIYGTSYIKGCV